MDIRSLLKDCEFDFIGFDAVAGTSTLTSDLAADMQGWDGILLIALTGDATSGTVLTFTALGVATNAVSGGVAIPGASATYTSLSATDADRKMLILDIFRPQQRYVYTTLARATQNCVSNGVIAIKYRGSKSPFTQSASHVIASTYVAPAA